MGSASQVDWAGYMELRGVDNSCGAVRTAGAGLLHAVSLHIWLLMAALLPVLRWKYRLNLCASGLRVLVPVRGAVPHVCSRNQDRMFRLWRIDGVTKA